MRRQLPAVHVEQMGCAAVASAQGSSHELYEDRFRLLCNPVPLVERAGRGEVFAVFDGIGSAPRGMHSAQHLADSLIQFIRGAPEIPARSEALRALLLQANQEVYDWGMMPDSDRPLGGCAGTIAWLLEDELCLFHAGDTVAWTITSESWHRETTDHGTGSMIHRYFGMGEALELESKRLKVEDGDRLLMVSDGVTKVLGEPAIVAMAGNSVPISRAVEKIASESQARGSQDDITVLVVEFELG